ncbi:heat-inducible transcriptional repressor HrcA [Aciditerrimonas ferrireducens]|jgi:heat-inducible transcriptional repressor|uniref:Heat-inducible transcription repressor HrcA n=1 Tax=Aciditerrimonas ferrireducens TaxID=667306 RepID=A0ABV6BZY3_9ACTN|nr:heat-inducible transcriptional repressor HrcA [Aciditerrimonas ferrireducens]MCK4176504.1 heat-inducible transcriptional repressor HrcA [Aciditerrimonas ferrireducens]
MAERAERPSGRRAERPEARPELDERKAAILNAVVAEYIETAQPVGSAHVTRRPGIDVSAATVRNEMASLEREGFLVQPHTSAGRIPTDKGYRFFVDHLATSQGALDESQRQEVRRFFAEVHGEVEELLSRTSGLLTELTNYATVVVGPRHEQAPVRSVQLVGLAPTVALLVVVLGDGAVEKRTLEFAEEVSEAALGGATAHLARSWTGRTLGQLAREGVGSSGDPVVDRIGKAAAEAIAALAEGPEAEQVFVGGSSRVASAFDAVETVRSVLAILEQQLVVVELIEEVLDRGLSVAIGAEHGFEPLASCALVVSPVEVQGETTGVIGVLGPTRMNYPRALAAVQLVGEQLSSRIAQVLGAEGPGRFTSGGRGDQGGRRGVGSS